MRAKEDRKKSQSRNLVMTGVATEQQLLSIWHSFLTTRCAPWAHDFQPSLEKRANKRCQASEGPEKRGLPELAILYKDVYG